MSMDRRVASVARMKPKAQYGNSAAVPTPYYAALHTGYMLVLFVQAVQTAWIAASLRSSQ